MTVKQATVLRFREIMDKHHRLMGGETYATGNDEDTTIIRFSRELSETDRRKEWNHPKSKKKDTGSRHFNTESKGRNDSSEGFDGSSGDLYQNSGIHAQRQREDVQPARYIDRRPEGKAQRIGGTTGVSIIHHKTSKVTKKKKIKSEKKCSP